VRAGALGSLRMALSAPFSLPRPSAVATLSCAAFRYRHDLDYTDEDGRKIAIKYEVEPAPDLDVAMLDDEADLEAVEGAWSFRRSPREERFARARRKGAPP
jgi:hypothetical protein